MDYITTCITVLAITAVFGHYTFQFAWQTSLSIWCIFSLSALVWCEKTHWTGLYNANMYFNIHTNIQVESETLVAYDFPKHNFFWKVLNSAPLNFPFHQLRLLFFSHKTAQKSVFLTEIDAVQSMFIYIQVVHNFYFSFMIITVTKWKRVRWPRQIACIKMSRKAYPSHSSTIWWERLTLRRLRSYIYGAPILDVSRSHTTTQHSR